MRQRWIDHDARYVLVMSGQDSTYLGFDLESALLVMIDECFHGLLFIVGHSIEDFAPHIRPFQHSFQTRRVLVDIFSKKRERIGLRVPEPRA